LVSRPDRNCSVLRPSPKHLAAMVLGGVWGAMGVGSTVGTGTLLGLFGYNRANYLFDVGMRFERFQAGREFAIAQADMYREDLRTLSALTIKKNTVYADTAALGTALCVALYCAGRLGLHGPSPPNWIMGLWYTNNAAAFSFLILTIWLATHAIGRAHTASVHLLTRKTRLPVPSLKQLDKARRFASEFEQSAFSDIFRVPYVSNNGDPLRGSEAVSTGAASASSRSRSAPPGKRLNRASTWVRDEWDTDKAGTVMGSASDVHQADSAAPEHFVMYQRVMRYWVQYDMYARVCFFLAILHFIHSLAFYSLGHINVELRCFWVPYAVGFILMVLHGLIMKFDLVGKRKGGDMLDNCQWAAQVAWLAAAIGMSFDFKVQFDMNGIIFTWVCIFIAYLAQLLYSIRLLFVILPDDWKKPSPQEHIGSSWWPQGWAVPSTFQHVMYVVAPPQSLRPGQNDIYREVKAGTAEVLDGVGESIPPADSDRREQVHPSVQYVERIFDWATDDRVMNSLSKSGQNRVYQLQTSFLKARDTTKGDANVKQVCNDVIQGMDIICAEEDIKLFETIRRDGSASDTAGSADDWYEEIGNEAGADDAPKQTSSRGPKPKAPFLHTENVEPWRLVASIMLAAVIGWTFLTLGEVVDCILGEQALITAPHWSRPPMTRASWEPHELGTPIGFTWYAGAKPYLPEQMAWHEEKRHVGSLHIGRRLFSNDAKDSLPLHGTANGLLAATAGLVSAIGRAPETKSVPNGPSSWPPFFEPQLLACGPRQAGGGRKVLALTQRGFGAAAHIDDNDRLSPHPTTSFSLVGIQSLAPFLSASWGVLGTGNEEGLLLVSESGRLLACPGPQPQEAGGTWQCGPAVGFPASLPLSKGSRLIAATFARVEHRIHVALVDHHSPDVVALFAQDSRESDNAWSPLGELRLPQTDGNAQSTARVSLAFTDAGEIFVATEGGFMAQQRLFDGVTVASGDHSLQSKDSWRAACPLRHGPMNTTVAHLRLEKTGQFYSHRPAIVSTAIAKYQKLLFQ